MDTLDLSNFHKYLNSDSPKRIRQLIDGCQNEKTDKRKLKLKKLEYQSYAKLIRYCIEYYKFEPRYRDLYDYLIQVVVEHDHYAPLPNNLKIQFLKDADNAFIIFFAERFNTYISSNGKITPIAQLHPSHFESIVNKMKKENYQLPRQFNPVQLNIK